MTPKSTKQIIKEIGIKGLDLFQDEDFWYFEFDRGDVYELQAVSGVSRLHDMSLEEWVRIGTDFGEQMMERLDA